MFLFTPLLLVLVLLHRGFCDDCQPGFADTCFTSVTDDLKYMLNLNKMVAINVSTKAVHDLCMALDDSLNCTSDIIDEDCGMEDGRARFDSWIRALRGAYDYVCEGKEHKSLQKLLRAIPCWSLEDFIFCCEDRLTLNHIRDLLHRKMDKKECRSLHSAMRKCTKEATVDSCREQEDVVIEVTKMISAFFSASDCEFEKVVSTSSRLYAAASTAALLLVLWLTNIRNYSFEIL